MYLDLFGCMSGIDESDSGADASAGIFVQGPAVSALPLSLALKDAAAGDQGSLVELFRKLAEGEIDEGDVLQVSVVAFVMSKKEVMVSIKVCEPSKSHLLTHDVFRPFPRRRLPAQSTWLTAPMHS